MKQEACFAELITTREGRGRLRDNHEKITAGVTRALDVQRRPTCFVIELGCRQGLSEEVVLNFGAEKWSRG